MENDQLRIGEQGISVMLLKVVPGNEMTVINGLRVLGGEFYFGMGKHDVVVVKEADEFEPLTGYMKHCDVTDWGSLHVFKYEPKNAKIKTIVKDKILGICCLKLEYHMLCSEGVSKELELVSRLYQILYQQQSVNVIVGGSIGFYDIVIFLETSTFDALDEAVREICEVAEKFGIVKDIVTIPCINSNRLLDTNGNYMSIDALVAEFPEQVSAQIMIDCVPGPEVVISNLASEIFGIHPRGIFGEHDLMIHVEGEPLGSLLYKVLSFRKKSTGSIFSTLTILGFDFKERAVTAPLKQPSVEPHFSTLMTRLLDFQDRSQKTYATDLASEFIRILGLIKRVEINLTTNGIFREICPLLFQVAEAIERLEIEEDVYKEYCNIYETLTELTYSLFQRYSGVEGPYLFRIPSTSVEEYGGINRLIYALEALPAICMRKVKQSWKGFCMFGYAPEPRRFEFGIISMPRTVLLHPEKWHGAFHESGHESFGLLLRSLSAERRQELEKNLIRGDLDPYEQYKFIWEFFADSFAFIYGYNGNWELYLKTLWSLLLKRGARSEASLDMGHLLRTFAVFSAFRLTKIDEIEPKDAVRDFISDFREILRIDNRESIDWSSVERNLLVGFEISGKGIKTVMRMLREFPKPKDSLNEELSTCLKDGVIVSNADPAQVVYNLMLTGQDDKSSFKERMAAIMTLFDYTLRNRKPFV